MSDKPEISNILFLREFVMYLKTNYSSLSKNSVSYIYNLWIG